MSDITVFEKIKRELNTIHWIFNSQFAEKSSGIIFPIIHNDGRFCTSIYLRSHEKLCMIEEYKEYYTSRFEKSLQKDVIENELKEIKEKAIILRDYFNLNLTTDNEFIGLVIKSIRTSASTEINDKHTMIVFVEQHNGIHIYFKDSYIEDKIGMSIRKYNFHTNNRDLAEFCQKLILFVDTFGIDKKKIKPLADRNWYVFMNNTYIGWLLGILTIVFIAYMGWKGILKIISVFYLFAVIM